MASADPTTRLTTREKEVLRAWLGHKSAKEIALDLGITHHAVEKRLKMARTKLGAGSSREAARMLAVAEGYQVSVTGLPDLQPDTRPHSSWRHRPHVTGGLAMLTLTALGLALAAAYPSAEPVEIEIDADLTKLFEHLDRDDSGYLENPESPFVTVAFAEGSGLEQTEGNAALGDGPEPRRLAEFYATVDTDRDGRISFPEYRAWSEARRAELGIRTTTVMKVMPAPKS
jgi:DNA-binding CsgD family transcriptional regulator/Ca2+-binding EF-hand superfamily protein